MRRVRAGEIVNAAAVIGLLLVAEQLGGRRRERPGRRRPAPSELPARRRGVPHLAGGRAGPIPQHAQRLPARPARPTSPWLRRAPSHAGRRDGGGRRAPTSATCRPAGGRRPRWPERVAAVRSLHRFLAEEGRSADRPGRRRGCASRARRPAQAAHRGGGHGAARRGGRRRGRCIAGTGPSSSCCTAPACASASCAGCPSATSTPPAGWSGCSARGPRSGSCRSGDRRWPPPRTWLGPGGRPRMVPARWARRGDAEALFLNQRGGRLSRQAGWAIVTRYGSTSRPARPAEPARAAPLVRHPHARPRRGPASRPGAARARLDLDHAGVHEGLRPSGCGPSSSPPIPGPAGGERAAIGLRPRRRTSSGASSGSLSSRPPDAGRRGVGRVAPAAGRGRLWRRMNNQDRRHAITVARRFERFAGASATGPALAGALLHDVGKVDSGPRHLPARGGDARAGALGTRADPSLPAARGHRRRAVPAGWERPGCTVALVLGAGGAGRAPGRPRCRRRDLTPPASGGRQATHAVAGRPPDDAGGTSRLRRGCARWPGRRAAGSRRRAG